MTYMWIGRYIKVRKIGTASGDEFVGKTVSLGCGRYEQRKCA